MSKKSGKSRFNFIDVIVILAIVAVIGAAVLIVLSRSGVVSASKTAHVEYTVRFTLVREEFTSYVKTGDTVKNSSTGNDIGNVIAVRTPEKSVYSDARSIIGDGDEKTVAVSEFPDLYDLYITVSSTATLNDNGIAIVDGNMILIGSPIYFRDGLFAKEGFITAFEITQN